MSPFPAGDHNWQEWSDIKEWQTQDINHTNDQQKKYRLGAVSKNIFLDGLTRFLGANLTLSSDVDQDTLFNRSYWYSVFP